MNAYEKALLWWDCLTTDEQYEIGGPVLYNRSEFLEIYDDNVQFDFHPIRACKKEDDTWIEECSENGADYWGVYYRIREGNIKQLRHIADLPTKKDAVTLWLFLIRLHMGNSLSDINHKSKLWYNVGK